MSLDCIIRNCCERSTQHALPIRRAIFNHGNRSRGDEPMLDQLFRSFRNRACTHKQNQRLAGTSQRAPIRRLITFKFCSRERDAAAKSAMCQRYAGVGGASQCRGYAWNDLEW